MSGALTSIALSALMSLPCAAQTPSDPAQACAGCHSVQAVEAGNGQFPLLEGQTAYYLAKQLRDFASGARPSAVMQPIAKALDEKQMTDIAAHYASRPAPALKAPAAQAVQAKRGETLALIGDDRLMLQACVNCHGNTGRGEPPAVPYLAGQAGGYIVNQLKAFATGTRTNDEGALMRSAVAKMSDADVQAVAHYLSRVRPAGAAPAGREPVRR